MSYAQMNVGDGPNPAMSIRNEQENNWSNMNRQDNADRKKNFFERKRWLNYDVPNQPNSSAAQSENEEGGENSEPKTVG